MTEIRRDSIKEKRSFWELLIRGSLVRAQEGEQLKMIKPLYYYSVAVFALMTYMGLFS